MYYNMWFSYFTEMWHMSKNRCYCRL